VVDVSQVVTLDRGQLAERISRADPVVMAKIDDGQRGLGL
jgi:mRNA-degrading endonuclease toxin of MazEF toxin-antitoxin module